MLNQIMADTGMSYEQAYTFLKDPNNMQTARWKNSFENIVSARAFQDPQYAMPGQQAATLEKYRKILTEEYRRAGGMPGGAAPQAQPQTQPQAQPQQGGGYQTGQGANGWANPDPQYRRPSPANGRTIQPDAAGNWFYTNPDGSQGTPYTGRQ